LLLKSKKELLVRFYLLRLFVWFRLLVATWSFSSVPLVSGIVVA